MTRAFRNDVLKKDRASLILMLNVDDFVAGLLHMSSVDEVASRPNRIQRPLAEQ